MGVVVALALVLLQGEAVPSALADELALRSAVHLGRASALSATADWRLRARALEGLERRAQAGHALAPEERVLGRLGLSDPHPNVRARALALLAAAGGELLTADELARAAGEELAALRLALATALDTLAAPGRPATLLALAFESDERVRSAARATLCGLERSEPGALTALATLAARVAAEEDEPAFARLCEALFHAGLDEPVLGLLRAAVRDEARAALVEATALAAGHAGAVQVVVRGLTVLADEHWDPVRARVFAAAGNARSLALARALAGSLRAGEASLAEQARRTLFVASLPRATAWQELAALTPPPAWLAELVPSVADELDGLARAPVAAWLAPAAAPELRSALVGAAAACFTRTGDAASEQLLVRALEVSRSELAQRAFDCLAGARALRAESEAALFAAWSTRTEARQIADLASFTRVRAWRAFRADWLALGARVPAARAALCELLAPLGPAAEAGAELARWLEEDGEALAAGAAPAREVEQRLQAELRALARLAPERSAAFDALLTRALGCSTEVGKLAVAGLGRSEEGRARLLARLARGDLAGEADRRTRIEAGIQLASHLRGAAREPARALLLQEREHATWELRERVLVARAAGAEEADLAALSALLAAPGTEALERAALAGLLAREFGARAAPALFALLRSRFELEARRAALAALGGLAGTAAGLGAFLDELTRTPEAAGAPEEQAVLRGEALVALAAADPADARLGPAWLASPRARAADDLAARLAGRELSALEFTWRAELELARRLTAAGRLAAALEESEAWWTLDGRLLAELGQIALASEPEAARALLRAALVARLGERDPEPRELARLRAHLAALALRAGATDELARHLAPLLAARRAGRFGASTWQELTRLVLPRAEEPESALRGLYARAVASVR